MAPMSPTVAPQMSITDTFDDRDSMKNLLNRIGLSSMFIIRLMQIEGFESSRNLALTRIVDPKATVQNVNKLFGSSQRTGTRIYFPPIKVAKIEALNVYLRRCLMINQIPDVRLITLDKCQAFVDYYTSWTEEGADTDEVVKNKKINSNPVKFKRFQDEFKTLLCSVRVRREITLEYIIRIGDIVTLPIEVAEPDVNSNEVLVKIPHFSDHTLLEITLTCLLF